MSRSSHYVPPTVWTWSQATSTGGRFANINRPTSGPTHDQVLPVGIHPIQLYSMATPNGIKATIMLEELLALGHRGAEYDAWLIKINEGDQFGSGFVAVNPNSKIPALMDYRPNLKPGHKHEQKPHHEPKHEHNHNHNHHNHNSSEPIRVFESGSILLYLAEKFQAFLPTEIRARTECLSWLFWQVGSAPILGGGFGHFYFYAPIKIEYAINRFAMEVKRQLDVLDKHLQDKEYIAGDTYTIADIAIWPWYGGLIKDGLYKADEFLAVQDYPHVQRWAKMISDRPAVQRGWRVNRMGNPLGLQERHDASDFDRSDATNHA